ncbi:MAG: acyl-CoA dehydrogenase family protein, partial [Candidatus Dormibacteraceae bacterium]
MTRTHEVLNQVPPLEDFDASDHPIYEETLARAGAADALAEVRTVGVAAGSERCRRLGDLAEAHAPVLHTHDRYGNRVDRVEYDPAYHELMAGALSYGLAGAAWRDPRPYAHLIRAVKYSAWYATDAGHCCPVTMTYAAVPALRADPRAAARLEPLLTSTVYDPTVAAPLTKRGLIAGMSMTEKQGGSDVRANTTAARAQADGGYLLRGHKWFTSAPMSDILLTLAQAPGGLSCFVVPRVLADGTMNRVLLQRLKDKLGDRSNASSEIELDEAWGWRLGEEGRGVATIVKMVNSTRLDCTIATASLMRLAVLYATHHVLHRAAFGAKLIEQPLMRNVVADLAVEAEASLTVAFFLAGLTDRAASGDEAARLLQRLALAVSKYYVCKRGPAHTAEAMECLGGNG